MKLKHLLILCAAGASWLSGAATAQDLNTLRSLAATCANCHGTNGVSRGEVPSLAGVAADATIAKMAAYKSGALSATVMHQIAKGYTDEQIKQLATFFAAQPAK